MDDITKPIVNKRKHCALIHCVQVGLERLRKAEKKRTFIVTNLRKEKLHHSDNTSWCFMYYLQNEWPFVISV